MFTGIVEEIGTIKKIVYGEKSSRLSVRCNRVLNRSKVGDSISTNGVCLTITSLFDWGFEADVMAETLRKSNLGYLKNGMRVNLERALTLDSRLGGHMVSGHIDGIGRVLSFFKEDNAVWITVEVNDNILKYIVLKGSVAIDGVSLTVAYVDNKVFKVSIIPHTGEATILLEKMPLDYVNIECDLIGKYVERLLLFNKDTEKKSNINEDFLRSNGFM